MYTAALDVNIGTYPDLWRKDRYRVDLNVELHFDPDNIDAALKQLGYHIIDTGQWGQSYNHKHYHNLSAELNEVEDTQAYVRLLLRNSDLDEGSIGGAEDYLSGLFDRIFQICLRQGEGYNYEPLRNWNYPEVDESLP